MTTNEFGAGVGGIDELPLMLTVEEAAGIMRIGRNTAYNAVADGSLPAIRIGTRIRIPRAGLASLLRTGAATPPGPMVAATSSADDPNDEE